MSRVPYRLRYAARRASVTVEVVCRILSCNDGKLEKYDGCICIFVVVSCMLELKYFC